MIFAWSYDEERYDELGDFANKEEAVAAALSCEEIREHYVIWIGKKVEVDATRFIPDIGDWLMEEMADRAGDDYGELADDWPSASREDIEVLNETLRAVTKMWIQAHSEINFWTVDDVFVCNVQPAGDN